MGILGILNSFDSSVMQLGDRYTTLLFAALFTIGPLIAGFILQGIGLSRMAKNRNIHKRALAFIPFVNIYFMGKLAGECSFFGQKVKKVGLYAMLAQIISTLLMATTIGVGLYIYVNYGTPDETSVFGIPFWSALPATENALYTIFEVSYWVNQIVYFVFEILMVMLLMGLYKRYVPSNYVLFALISFLSMPIASNIIIFVIRNRKAIDYDAYMREKREAFFRRQQEYQRRYGNPYNNPYGNPYHNPYNQNNTKKSDDEPFAEFTSDKNNSNNNADAQQSGTGNSDGFFD